MHRAVATEIVWLLEPVGSRRRAAVLLCCSQAPISSEHGLQSSEVRMKARLGATNRLILHGLGFFPLCKTDNTLIKLHSCDLLSYFSRQCYVIAVWLTSLVHPCAPIWEELQVGKSEVFSGKTGLLEYLFRKTAK